MDEYERIANSIGEEATATLMAQLEELNKQKEELAEKIKTEVIDKIIEQSPVTREDAEDWFKSNVHVSKKAAEIGLNPSQFLTYIIRTSLRQRILADKNGHRFDGVMQKLDAAIHQAKSAAAAKTKVAVILGGYSSERHISVESGRNIYEKLSSSSKYQPVPVFLTGDHENHIMYQIPINVLLKDNADDIKDKIENWKVHPVVKRISVS